jgi:hypothetical protein
MSDEICPFLHISRKYGGIVQYIKIVVLLIGALQAADFSQMPPAG